MTQEYPPMMTTAEAAEYLGLPPLTVRRMARDGELPALKIGRQWRLKKTLLDQWVAKGALNNIEKES